jgi:single-strand DNA-binding protein
MSFAKFQFIGNLTRDTAFNPEKDGPAIIDIAVNIVYFRGQDRVEETDYFRIKCFEGLAKSAHKYLGKGSKCYFEGRIKPTKFERVPGSGEFEYGFDFIASFIDYLEIKAPGQQ